MSDEELMQSRVLAYEDGWKDALMLCERICVGVREQATAQGSLGRSTAANECVFLIQQRRQKPVLPVDAPLPSGLDPKT